MKLRILFLYSISFFVIITACVDPKKNTGDDSPPKMSEDPVVIEKAKPVSLSPATMKEFIQWASGSDLEEREKIREEIQAASKDEELLELLFKEYEESSRKDFGYGLIVLSIIGEMQNPKALPKLERIIYQEIPERNEKFHSGLMKSDIVEILSSKAVECAAYLKMEESNRLILNVASQHPSKAVRSAAIDAFLFNNGDSEEAKQTLKELLPKEEVLLIDRTRFVRNSEKERFDEQLKLFYEKHPEEVAPDPEPEDEVDDRVKDSLVIAQPINPPKRKQQ